MECQKNNNLQECSCTYPGCPRKGFCCECISHHRKKGEVPGCLFSEEGEKSYDRSLSNFINDKKK